MGFLDRLFRTERGAGQTAAAGPDEASGAEAAEAVDVRVLERYRLLLGTAPTETIEAVHREAFELLTDDQRALVYEGLSAGAGTGERPLSSEPATLARAASRAELRQPGRLERVLSESAGGALLGVVADHVVGSALASAFLPWDGRKQPPAPSPAPPAG